MTRNRPFWRVRLVFCPCPAKFPESSRPAHPDDRRRAGTPSLPKVDDPLLSFELHARTVDLLRALVSALAEMSGGTVAGLRPANAAIWPRRWTLRPTSTDALLGTSFRYPRIRRLNGQMDPREGDRSVCAVSSPRGTASNRLPVSTSTASLPTVKGVSGLSRWQTSAIRRFDA